MNFIEPAQVVRMLATERVENIAEPAHAAADAAAAAAGDRFDIDSSLMDKTEQFRASLRGVLPQQRFRG